MRGLFLNYLFSRFSSCGLRSQEVISVVLFLETLVLCLLFSNFKKALNQRWLMCYVEMYRMVPTYLLKFFYIKICSQPRIESVNIYNFWPRAADQSELVTDWFCPITGRLSTHLHMQSILWNEIYKGMLPQTKVNIKIII